VRRYASICALALAAAAFAAGALAAGEVLDTSPEVMKKRHEI
jgi:hypothetical protein